jgi:hypothetical protein
MDHRRLQRALVVALHDDVTLAALSLGGEALATLGLTPDEAAALAAVDPRALRTDPARPRRMLATLADEYKASTSLLLAGGCTWASLTGFFADPSFRDAIMGDRALAVAFGGYLAGLAQARGVVGDVVAIELARARCRRPAPPPAGLGLAPGVAVLAVDQAALPLLQEVERWHFELARMPQVVLAADAPRPPEPSASGSSVHLVVQPGPAGPAVSEIDADLALVLGTLASPRPRQEALEGIVRAGIAKERAAALAAALIDDGLLAEG